MKEKRNQKTRLVAVSLLFAAVLLLGPVPVMAQTTTMFSDNFESYTSGAVLPGGNWTVTGSPYVRTTIAPYLKVLDMRDDHAITKGIDTRMYSSISLSFNSLSYKCAASDYLYIEYRTDPAAAWVEAWSRGGRWSWGTTTVNFPTDAEDIQTFQFRFRNITSNSTYYKYLDNIVLTGIFTPPDLPPWCDLSGINLLTPDKAQATCLEVGPDNLPFIDSNTYYVVWLPDKLKQLVWLRTYMSHKDSTASSFIQFTLNRPATVYVAYNHDHGFDQTYRPNPGPSWLRGPTSGWTYTFDRISIRYLYYGGANRPFYWDVWSKSYAANSTVTLGGNDATGSQTNTSYYHNSAMYMVLIDYEDASTGGPAIEYPTSISNIPPFFVSPPTPKITVLFDNSGSMRGTFYPEDEHYRYRSQVGRDVLVSLIDSMTNVELGLATYIGLRGSNPYPGDYVGCSSPPAGKSWPKWPAAGPYAAQTLDCLTYPCGNNYEVPTTVEIMNHVYPLTPELRNQLKYGPMSGLYFDRFFNSLPPFSNRWLSYHFSGQGYTTSSCYYSNMQGVEGICRTVNAGSGGYTPLAGSLYGIRDYYEQFMIDKELDPSSPFYNEAAACTKRFVLFITDGQETCQSTSHPPLAAAALRNLLKDNYGTYFPDEYNSNEIKTYVVGLGFSADDTTNMAPLNAIAIAGGTDANLDGDEDPTSGNAAFPAEDAASLEGSLLKAITEVVEGSFAGSAVAVETDNATGEGYVYRATFVPRDWSGDLEAYPLDENGDIDLAYYPDNPLWSVQDWLKNNWYSRPVYIAVPPSPYMFNFADVVGIANGGPYQEEEVAYFMGDSSKEKQNLGQYRSRVSGPLGDIIHSSPLFVGAPPYSYNFNDYAAYKETFANRRKMVYFGANDGFLHAADATTGEVLWSYCPYEVVPKLRNLLDPLYPHEYFVDGPPIAVDVYVQYAWRTLLVFALRGGGKSIHILDITDPDPSTADGAMERGGPRFFHSINDTARLGYNINRCAVVRAGDPAAPIWTLVFSSGLENGDQKGHMMFLDLETKDLYDVPLDGGLGTLGHYVTNFTVADTNLNRVADTIYAADLKGCIWKIDITDSNPTKWVVFHTAGNKSYPMFRAVDNYGNEQPITTGVEVTKSCQDICIMFGTGKLLNTTDKMNTAQQSFYAIIDNNDPGSYDLSRMDTGQLTPIYVYDNGDGTRSLSSVFTFNNGRGEYIDLPEQGERVILNPIIFLGMVFFATSTPDSNRCGSGGTSWLFFVPFYASCQQREEEPDLTDDISIDSHGDIIIGDKFDFPGHLYITDSHGNIIKKDEEGSTPFLQPRTWKEIIE